MRSWLMFSIGLALAPTVVAAQAPPGDAALVQPKDTVRVWSSALKVKGVRGVVTRAGVDTLGFTAPAGFRRLPREYVTNVASIQRIEVLEGRNRSLLRVLGQMGLGGVFGAMAGGVVGYGAGSLLCAYFGDCTSQDRKLAQLILASYGAAGGGAIGFVSGGIDGLRAEEQWRRVR